MESAFEEKQNEIKMLQEKVSDLETETPELMALKEKFQQEEAEMENLKQSFEEAFKSRRVRSNDSAILPEKVSENGIMAAHEETRTENERRDEQSHDQATKYEYGEGITNEDASKNKLTKFNVDDENQKGKGNNDSVAADTAKEMNEKIVDGEEHASFRQELGGKFENDTTRGGQEFSLKQLEDNPKISEHEKRKRVRVGRAKGKRWRTIVKEGHGAVNIRSRKLNRDKKNDKANESEEEEKGKDNPSKNEAEEQLQKPGSHDDIQDDRDKIVNYISHEVSDSDIGVHQKEQALDEDSQSEKQEESGVEQSWSRRHVNLVEMDAGHEKTGLLNKELEEPEATDAQEERDDINGGDEEDQGDDFSKESQPDLADENEYKGEMHEF